MNKIRKERQSEVRWLKQQRKLSRDYCHRMQRLKKEREREARIIGYPGEGKQESKSIQG